jgi:hypothetical protein
MPPVPSAAVVPPADVPPLVTAGVEPARPAEPEVRHAAEPRSDDAPAPAAVPSPAVIRPSPFRELTSLPAPPAPRPSFSVPTAAALIGLIAVAVYGVSLHGDRIDGLDADAVAEAPADADAAVAAVPPVPEPVAATVRAEGPVSAAEATDLVEEFRAAYEQRDLDRLVALFAPDATENGRRGLDAIRESYRTTLNGLDDVHYTLPSVAVAAGPRADVRAPFVISYAQPGGGRAEIHGDAEWELERRDGHARIVTLSYRLQPEG